MSLISLLDVSLSYGGPPLVNSANLQIDEGERVCLLGRNGAGKSSLMRILAGELKADRGDVFRQPGLRVARLQQDVPVDVSGRIHDLVLAGAESAKLHEEGWEMELRVEGLLKRMQLDPGAEFSSLSGGLKRRTLLACALAGSPHLLLLDEPTNHLDLDSIIWLEEFLLTEKVTLFFVTHDRVFLRRLATRIIELDRGRLAGWACDYDTYLVRKQEVLEAEEKQQAAFDKKLAQEEEWIRRGVRAQRSRSQGRVHALQSLREERRARRERMGNVSMALAEASRSGVKVIETEKLCFAYPGSAPIVKDFDTLITRGDKIGLVGPNGVGKTTFIKLLLGQLQPVSGTVKHGTNLEVVYFDQLRSQINDDKSVADNIANGSQTVTIDGRSRHVISYLQEFLFEPSRARSPARVLSGGERNRLLLARLFIKPANVLVLDEPTNDLDAETLELLENLLVEFQGTLLLVSHDREFVDNVVTSLFVFEGEGRISELVGGYADWIRQKTRAQEAQKAALAAQKGPAPKAGKARKLNNRERAELEALPARIEALETEQAELTLKIADPLFYQREPSEAPLVKARLDAIEKEHATAFERWAQLEALREASQ
jgi:ATP-binding cassette subfamily F protein uup